MHDTILQEQRRRRNLRWPEHACCSPRAPTTYMGRSLPEARTVVPVTGLAGSGGPGTGRLPSATLAPGPPASYASVNPTELEGLRMNARKPKKIATVGGALICASGVLNAALGARIGAVLYDVYPGGRMGHVGIISGVAAIVIGLVILLLITRLYERRNRGLLVLGGILTIVLGHAGAVAGAIYVGTAGVALCYVAGIWLLVAVVVNALTGKS